MKYDFIKMQGLGNDFVIFDARLHPFALSGPTIARIADRRVGIGCDQVIILQAPRDSNNDATMRIYNANGHEVGACGNATRCVGWLINNNGGAKIETAAGVLAVDNITLNGATAQMGQVKFAWQDIPLAYECDTTAIDLNIAGLPLGDCAAVGNPHIVFFIDDIDIEKYGPLIEHHPLFPQGTNAEFVQLIDGQTIKIRIWERGVGETAACGTGACAAAAIAHQRGLVGNKCQVISKGGILTVDFDSQYNVKISGEVAVSFTGQIDF